MTNLSSRGEVTSRYEAKYVVSEELAGAIRDAIQGICSPDEHVDSDGRYIVNNLYFDTASLCFCFDTRYRRYERFKPRVRYYGTEPRGFLWTELKHKQKSVTWKMRHRRSVDAWPDLLDDPCGHRQPELGATLASSFADAVLRFDARPVLRIRYVRELYVSEIDGYARVTFDRGLAFRAACGSFELSSDHAMPYCDSAEAMQWAGVQSPVILEIKTETYVPKWVLRLIRRFGLCQRGFSKYCHGIESCQVQAESLSLRTAVS